MKLRLKFGFYRLKFRLKIIKNNIYSPNQVLDLLFSKNYSLITPWQYEKEFLELLKHYHSLNAKNVMEIGTANGGTLFAHCKLANKNAKIISVDLPGGKFGGGYPEWKKPIYQEFALSSQNLHLIRGSSYDVNTYSEVKKLLNGELLDYIFIDGDHTYEGVKKDFQLYSKLVKKGGSIVFHDIALHEGSSCKVDEFWKEIKSDYECKEFIQDKMGGKFGIGILINK